MHLLCNNHSIWKAPSSQGRQSRKSSGGREIKDIGSLKYFIMEFRRHVRFVHIL